MHEIRKFRHYSARRWIKFIYRVSIDNMKILDKYRVPFFACAVLLTSFHTTNVFAQAGDPMAMGMGMGMGMGGGQQQARFEVSAPKIGDPLPDLSIFDDQGNPVNIRDLGGENYKVLVLGCLT
jgi:hypothetical protein